jgi:hypothetical protein
VVSVQSRWWVSTTIRDMATNSPSHTAGWLSVPTPTSNTRRRRGCVAASGSPPTDGTRGMDDDQPGSHDHFGVIPNRRRRGFRVGGRSCEVGIGGTLHPGGEFLGLVTVGHVASDHPLDVVGHLGGRKLVPAQLATETRVQSEAAA